MSIRINDTIPDIAVDTDKGMFSMHEWIGNSWAILFSHPSAPLNSVPLQN